MRCEAVALDTLKGRGSYRRNPQNLNGLRR
jgi:hypothetical protein